MVSSGESLSLHLAASEHVVSFVLTQEDYGVQQSVYYMNHVLSSTETQYQPVEKLALALVQTAQKLHPYFQAHPIRVVTDQML